MIDYLEELLEEEAAVDLEGNPLSIVGGRKKIQTEDEEDPDQADRLGQFLKEEPAGRVPAAEEWPGTVRSLASAPWAEALTRGRVLWVGEGQRTGAAAAGLVEGLRRAAQAARLAAGGTSAATARLPEAEPTARMNPDLLALDRAVRRDARRYDGGFALY